MAGIVNEAGPFAPSRFVQRNQLGRRAQPWCTPFDDPAVGAGTSRARPLLKARPGKSLPLESSIGVQRERVGRNTGCRLAARMTGLRERRMPTPFHTLISGRRLITDQLGRLVALVTSARHPDYDDAAGTPSGPPIG